MKSFVFDKNLIIQGVLEHFQVPFREPHFSLVATDRELLCPAPRAIGPTACWVDFSWGLVGSDRGDGERHRLPVLVVQDQTKLSLLPNFVWLAEEYGELAEPLSWERRAQKKEAH